MAQMPLSYGKSFRFHSREMGNHQGDLNRQVTQPDLHLNCLKIHRVHIGYINNLRDISVHKKLEQ